MAQFRDFTGGIGKMRDKIVASLICLLLMGLVLSAVQCGGNGSYTVGDSTLSRFTSKEELNKFVKTRIETYSKQAEGWPPAPRGGDFFSMDESSGALQGNGSVEYSTTNIQVEGVDEADIVKTDGQFIYIVSDETVFIVKAYPAGDAQVLSKIVLDNRPDGIFINGDRLVILQQNWNELVVRYESDEKMVMPEREPVSQTYIKVYDVADREDPVLKREVAVDGYYSGSRMVGSYVYVVINQQAARYDDDKVGIPRIQIGGTAKEIPASEIYYADIPDYSYMFTTVMAVNTQNDDQEPSSETLLLGATHSMYVSADNIYVTSTRWGYRDNSEKTAIHRIHFQDGNIEYKASGEVPGRLLNQFSMDEYRGFFRVATTTSGTGVERDATFAENSSANHLYILDMDLSIVGSLEDLAPGESIYSARFMGERCYLVTFKQIDPFFVIDLRNPYHPKVLGELKITGYSDYLHPYDENHIIGIGKETVAADQGDFAWYQGVKISLFDVSDVGNPVEIAKYEIGDRGTESPVLRDHKALLFDRSKNLLVLPVLVAEIGEGKYPYGDTPEAYGEYVWQGAYVFNISLDEEMSLKGRITHYDSQSQLTERDYYFTSDYSVERSLYIDDVLYTISAKKISMNSLEDLSQISEVGLL